jgi:hypothetical protein
MNSNRLGWMEHQAQGSIIRSRRRNYLSISGVQDGKVVCIDQSSSFRGDRPVSSPKQLRASVTERRSCAPARVPMNVISTQNVWFDDAATLAMGEAFDNACQSLQNFGSAVPAIIADLIIAGAKNGERDPARLSLPQTQPW